MHAGRLLVSHFGWCGQSSVECHHPCCYTKEGLVAALHLGCKVCLTSQRWGADYHVRVHKVGHKMADCLAALFVREAWRVEGCGWRVASSCDQVLFVSAS